MGNILMTSRLTILLWLMLSVKMKTIMQDATLMGVIVAEIVPIQIMAKIIALNAFAMQNHQSTPYVSSSTSK